MFGSPETTSGGRALKFYSSVRMDIRRIGAVKDGSDVIGNRTRVKIKKNKVAPPFKQAEFDIIYGEGISSVGELVDLGVEHDIIEKSGSWYSYDGDTVGQGREAIKEWLRENDEMRELIKTRVRVALGMLDEDALPQEATNGVAEEKEETADA
jgi:recombination protein RecA